MTAEGRDDAVNRFEVGRFYLVQTSAWTSRKIPALCVKKGKRSIHFEYMHGNLDGTLCKLVCRRSLGYNAGGEVAYSNDTWSTIMPTYPSDEAAKPRRWDELPSEFGKRRKGGRTAETEKAVEPVDKSVNGKSGKGIPC